MTRAGQDVAPSRDRRAPSTLRTISEVADDLHVPQHVLRAWEAKFPELRPTKKGGRRYYRDEDVCLLRRISSLVYDQHLGIDDARRSMDGVGITPLAPPADDATVARTAVSECPARLRPVLAVILAELVAMRAALN